MLWLKKPIVLVPVQVNQVLKDLVCVQYWWFLNLLVFLGGGGIEYQGIIWKGVGWINSNFRLG